MKKSISDYLKLTGAMIMVVFLFFITGCISSKYRTPELPPWQVATIISSDPDDVRIYKIDGLIATGKLKGERVGEFPGTVIVDSGSHVIIPCYMNRGAGVVYGEPVRFYTQHEQDYIIRHKVKWDKSIRFWVENNGVDITTEY